MGERPQPGSTKVSRRIFLLSLAASATAVESACSIPVAALPPQDSSPAYSPRSSISSASTLSAFMKPDLVRELGLGKIASTPVRVHQIEGDRPTYIYQYDPSIEVDPEATQALFDVTRIKNFPDLIESYKKGQNPSDIVVNTNGTTTFRYDYSPNRADLPMAINIFTSSDVVLERHMLIVDNDTKPSWAKNDASTTYNHAVKDNKQVRVSVINKSLIKGWDGNLQSNLTRGFATEVYQQTLAVIARIMDPRPSITPNVAGHLAQEGVCNGLGLAVQEKSKGQPWEDTAKLLAETLYRVPGLPDSRPFPPTDAIYRLLPNSRLLTAK